MKTFVALAIVGALAGTAVADEACPKTSLWGQPQDFWSGDPNASPPGSTPRKQLTVRYDGRWAGAAQVPLDNGTSTSRVRLLDGNDGNLYVSMEIDTLGTDREVFWFGFAPATATDGNGATLIELTLHPDPNPGGTKNFDQASILCGAFAANCPTPGGCLTPCAALPAASASVRLLHGVAGAAGDTQSKFLWDQPAYDNTQAATAAGAWLAPGASPGSRAWRGPLYSAPDAPPTGATIMLRIPNTVLGPAVADMKVWAAAATCTSLGTGPVNCSQQGNWPTAGEVDELATNTYGAPLLSDWGMMRRTTACAPQANLASAGVQNTPPGGTYNATLPFTYPQRINLDNDGNLTNDPLNFFAARVDLPNGATADKYQARFFAADWGSQIGNLDISQWFELGQVRSIGGGAGTTEDLHMQWPPPTMTAADQKILACKYSNCTAATPGCPYPTGVMPDPCAGVAGARTHAPHQCTQVRLENLTGSGSIQFARDSMIFNTDFVGASTYWRVATISTAAMSTVKPAPAPVSDAGRDIYIYARAINLPKNSSEFPAHVTTQRLEELAKAAGKPPVTAPNAPLPLELKFARTIRETVGVDGSDEGAQQKALLAMRKMPLDTVRLIAPTLEFRVFYDTGRLMDSHTGKQFHWLAPMTGFGYVVEHSGKVKIKGWEWALDGAEPLGDNWFRIRLRDGTEQQVRTRVQAVEDDRMPPGNPLWPPGKAWLGRGGKGTIKVKIAKTGGCAVGGDASPMTIVLLAAALWLSRRRRAA